ncbi:hypothetical protein BVRB_5g107580 [Beta vulgaris subsp. vulgaris]|nr:hypothetical protein BVRB_5g107580 [Beta vulgaris subsp. vulgaris]
MFNDPTKLNGSLELYSDLSYLTVLSMFITLTLFVIMNFLIRFFLSAS